MIARGETLNSSGRATHRQRSRQVTSSSRTNHAALTPLRRPPDAAGPPVSSAAMAPLQAALDRIGVGLILRQDLLNEDVHVAGVTGDFGDQTEVDKA